MIREFFSHPKQGKPFQTNKSPFQVKRRNLWENKYGSMGIWEFFRTETPLVNNQRSSVISHQWSVSG